MKKITLFLLFFFLIYFYYPNSILAATLFSDNFDNPSESSENWEIFYYNPMGEPMINGDGSIANWRFENKMCGLSVTNTYRSSQMSFLFPKNWNNNWKNYIYQVDFKIVRGVDTNLILKFTDSSHWYGLHGINNENKLYFETVNQQWSPSPGVIPFIFSYNTWYRIRNEIDEGKIKISIKNLNTQVENVLWNVLDHNIISAEGKPGLSASTGADNSVEVWFDNVLVTNLDGPDLTPTPTLPPTPTPTPVPLTVFIPGLGGSFSFKGIFLNDKNANDWQMTPGAHVYDNILKAFDEDSNFHVFHYDWRKSVLDSAQKLNSFIEEKIGTGSASVNLIGHSLGGLVGRTCIEKQNGCHASKLITVGSPHLGVVDVYPAVQGGEIWRKGFMKLAFELLIHYYQKPGETRKDTIEREAPVLKELLPEFDYLTKNGSAIPWNSLQIKNSLLPQLTNSSAYSGIAQTVTGNNKSTLKSISVTDPNWLDNILGVWPDGKPSGPGVFANEGDGTVLAKSASLINLGVSNHQFDLDHGEIISSTSALEKIFSLLGKTLPEKEYSSSLDTENYLVFVAHSPIALSSPQATPDQHLHPELIIVPNPGNKQYNLVVKGADSGSYQFSVGQIFGDKVIWNDYFGQATAGLLETYSFNISQDNPLEDPFVNTNNSLKNLIIRAVSELKNSVNQQVAEAYHQNFLFYYLDNILSQLDNNPEKAIFYSNLFRDAVNYCRKSSILSNQEALNLLGKTDYLASLLETYSLNFPKTFSPEEVEQRINLAKSARELAENNVADKSRALVYLKALEKLEKAISLADLQRKHLYSSQAQFLFLESRLPN